MVDVLYTGDLDLDAVRTREGLAALLQTVYLRADKPSLRTLEARTRKGPTFLSKNIAGDICKGARFPGKAEMVAFLRACGVPDDAIEQWRRAWELVASAEGQRTGGAGSSDPSDADELRANINRLREVNEQLRSQLAVTQRQAADDARPDAPPQGQEGLTPQSRQSVWHFPDGSPITLVSYRLPIDRRPPSADPADPNYVRFADLADLDTLIDIYGAVRAYNPLSRVNIKAAQDLEQRDVRTHLLLIGGLTWEAVTPWFSRIFSIPIVAGDPYEHGAIMVKDPGDGEQAFEYTLSAGELVEDIGFFACGSNPSAPRRTLTICGGITTRGVRGSALCFIDWEIRESNEQYLMPRLRADGTYCIVMRVPILNRDPLAPDLSKRENRLFEWPRQDA